MDPGLLLLARKVARHPGRALLRLVLLARLRRLDETRERARMLALVSSVWQVDARALSAEYRGSPFARWYRARLRHLRAGRGPWRMGISDGFSCELLYLLVRAARPQLVVETGVLYGASSAHVLAAMAANGRGELHSIDLGCGPAEPTHDALVPPDLASRWRYHEGDVRALLPPLLARLGRIDLFHHDSLHTFEHMTWEYRTAIGALKEGGVLSSHDVRVAHGLSGLFRENAFPAFCRRRNLEHFLLRNSGFALKPLGGGRPSRHALVATGARPVDQS